MNSLIKWVRENLYGLFLIVAVGIIAEIISDSNNRLSSPVISLLIGVVLANSGVLGSWAKPSLELASGRILKIGICLLGFRLAFSEITEIGSPIGVLIVIAVV
ncbi:MAG: putative sulfate exporter family transporter, partial [Acidimicrobiales bacterium]|nr:putative sulfate exporter family transporter [Acidimicrobiales bacterium]